MTNAPVHSEQHNGYVVSIYHDDDPESPRTWDSLGTMACWHRRYHLGDEQLRDSVPLYLARLVNDLYDDDCKAQRLYREPGETRHDVYGISESWFEHRWAGDSCARLLDAISNKAVILPLYLYDHSGITMNTTGFHCPWDSGQVGFIFVSLEDVRREYGVQRVSGKLRRTVEDALRAEVDVYDDYLRGEVYGYVIERDGDHVDSCWGYFGDFEEHCLGEARRLCCQ
ncbi:hypothetical protein [Parvibaculum sp.]|uniref:hypothetical protein n=1 Tax=Parvibaculum sp. TaxID=2024848 RepID=UPI000EB831CE|nr:hypothetical protein [Parvibaculum sp.]HCX67884.1 hypothetical protein [Rhodobiaceae bacterium]